MAKKKRDSYVKVSWFGPDGIACSNRKIVLKPTITIEGDFHKGIASLIAQDVMDRIGKVCGDVAKYLRAPSEDQEVSGKEVTD